MFDIKAKVAADGVKWNAFEGIEKAEMRSVPWKG
jgi:hypothetical protein